tara:strand:+ start:1316 stop:2200 length:885 start_codon:yes stop_codon:yes gene_type:complete
MAEQAQQVQGTVEPVKKTAFVSKPYSREDRIKQDEEELKQLLKEQKELKKNDDNSETESNNEESPEEKTFKKRYSDLRRHQQKQAEDFKKEIETLKSQLSEATKKEIKFPKSDEDIEKWAKEYPDVAAIVESIAMKKSKEQADEYEKKIQAIEDMQHSATKEKAEAELMRLHPDFDDIRDSDDFHDWVEQQPQWVQKALYENDNDAKSAARAIDLYKSDKSKSEKAPKKNTTDAAKTIDTKGERNAPQSDESLSYLKESVVEKMSAKEYERNSEKIMEAIRSGKFIYDVSGSAR